MLTYIFVLTAFFWRPIALLRENYIDLRYASYKLKGCSKVGVYHIASVLINLELLCELLLMSTEYQHVLHIIVT